MVTEIKCVFQWSTLYGQRDKVRIPVEYIIWSQDKVCIPVEYIIWSERCIALPIKTVTTAFRFIIYGMQLEKAFILLFVQNMHILL